MPESIPRYAKAGYEYELGSLAYWYEGPSVALIYKASRDQTVVPVVPIGKITSDVSAFEEYRDTIVENKNATLAQISMVWMLCKKLWIVPIPGTCKPDRMQENMAVPGL